MSHASTPVVGLQAGNHAPWTTALGPGTPGTVVTAGPVNQYWPGSAIDSVGLILPNVTVTRMSMFFAVASAGLTAGGGGTFTITTYQSAITGSNKLFDAWVLSTSAASTGGTITTDFGGGVSLANSHAYRNLWTTANGDAGKNVFDGTSAKYLTIVLSCAGITSIATGIFTAHLSGYWN